MWKPLSESIICTVTWPSGRREQVELPAAGTAYRLREGDGRAVALPRERERG